MAHWTYDGDCGCDKWGQSFEAAKGLSQSPIDIVSDKCIINNVLQTNPFKLTYSSDGKQIIRQSHGHFKVDLVDQEITLRGGAIGAEKVFKLEQFHFHVGRNNNEGSEHTLSGKRYASEVHFVFWNSTNYSNFSQAADKADGLTVLGFFIDIAEIANQAFDGLFKNLETIHENFSEVEVNPKLCIEAIFRQVNFDKYFTYPGSLTTPPCFESVRWVVFAEPIKFSSGQVLALRKILRGFERNFRPVCKLNDRVVHKSF